MSVNKVVVDGKTVFDLTNDTVTEDTLLEGTTAHDAAGKTIKGAVVVAPIDSELSEESENPVQNKVITAKMAEIEEKIPESGSGGLGEYVTGTYTGTDAYAIEYENSNNTRYYEKVSVTVGQSGTSSTITSSEYPKTQEIELGFRPSFIAIDGEFYSSAEPIEKYYYKTVTKTINGTAQTPTASLVKINALEFTDTGFIVALNLNYRDITHHYTAFK